MADLSPYTIVQEITKDALDAAQTQKTAMVMRVHYQFIQASSTQSRPLSPFVLNPEVRRRSLIRLCARVADHVLSLPQFDYEGDSGSDIFPFFQGQAMSTGSESPLRSDRSSSPSHSIPPGFVSQPISPATWYPQHVPWQDFNTASTTVAATATTQLQSFPTPDFYAMQQQQQAAHHFQQQQQPPHGQRQAPSGQFYGSASF